MVVECRFKLTFMEEFGVMVWWEWVGRYDLLHCLPQQRFLR
jgi:hypothetical protein